MKFTLKSEDISVRGQTVKLQEMTAGARAEMLEAARVSQFKAQIVMVQHCALNPDGTPMFGAKDFDKVAAWPPDVIEAASDAVLALSGVNKGGATSPKA